MEWAKADAMSPSAGGISAKLPLISCVMPTYGRPDFVNEAVAMFLAQDYPHKELIVLNDCPEQNFKCSLPGVRVFNEERRYSSLGEKRNAAIELTNGDIIAVWDDDDVYLPWRLSYSLQQMQQLGVEFYRPAEFWAYWGDKPLHDNQATPGWVNHAFVMFTKSLWKQVGGYPGRNLNEDSGFFERIHRLQGESFISHSIEQQDRFFILRAKSKYVHISIRGGERPLDLTPGTYRVAPAPIADEPLRQHVERLVQARENGRAHKAASLPLISVCVALKNRSRLRAGDDTLTLFPNCVRSLVEAAEELSGKGTIELVVADFQSNDWPLDAWLATAAGPLELKLVPLDTHFSRGRGLNAAVSAATSERLFLCDADMLVQPAAIERAIEVIDSGKAWFPTYECLDRQGRPEFWQDFSHGMAAVRRDHFRLAGQIPEFESWGGEDDLFHDSLRRHVPIIRERSPYLKHQWHPESSRHENYVNPRQSDYRKHVSKVATRIQEEQAPTCRFQARHPHWKGEVHFFANGRMARPGIDVGTYVMNPECIVLNWDRWAAETLHWNSTLHAYQDPVKNFTMQKIEEL